MKALVTGGTGLVGTNLVKALLKQGYEVIITGHDAETMPKGFTGKYLQPSFIGIDWDAIGKVDVLFHEAAINDTTNMDREEMFRANVESSKKLFDYVISRGCKHIVYATSTAIYGDLEPPYTEEMAPKPLNPYAESKVAMEEIAAELAAEHKDVTIVGLRYCNVYGPGEKHKGKRATMIYQLAQRMHAGQRPKLFEFGEQKRDYIYVKDVVAANLLAAQAKESCIVNCGGGKATTFNEIIEILNELLGTSFKPEYMPNPYGDRYQSYTLCDMTKAKEKIGFVPQYDVASGVKDYYENEGLLD